MTESVTIVGEADAKTIRQMQNCIAVEDGARGVLCADNHLGYSQPIGGAVAYRDHISPSGVGYDIGCGNKAVRTDINGFDLEPEDLDRIMDAAAGKTRKRWTCSNRDCDWWQGPGQHKPDDGACPKCGHSKLTKRWQQISEGAIDFNEVQSQLRRRGIVLRGGAADEAPGAYKRLDEVLAAHGDQIRVTTHLHPIGVAMAGADTFDPYKD